MRDFIVYQIGPIKGLMYGASEDWRQYMVSQLPPLIRCASPLRDQQFRNDGRMLDAYKDNHSQFDTPRAILRRDHFDCTRADLVFANLSGAEKPSIGSAMEIAWAYDRQIPVIVVMQKDNVHQHAMIQEAAGWILEDLDEAIELVKHILLPEGIRGTSGFDAASHPMYVLPRNGETFVIGEVGGYGIADLPSIQTPIRKQ